jgi:hypothetical protein
LPAFTRFYGLRPEDFDRMTLREISEYRSQMQKAQAEAEAERRNQGG